MHRFLVIGTGSIGERHLRCFRNTGRATLGLCEINPQLRQDVAARYQVSEVFASLDDALQTHWDAALIATPAHTHIPIASRLADLGLHLLIEKPLSTTTAGVEDLIAKVAAKGLIAGVAYVWRSHPGLAAMREAIRSGRFGRPAHLVAVTGQNFPFFRPAYRQIYYADRSKGGGAIQDAMTHILNMGQWLLGPIDRLAADASHQVLDGTTVEDTVNLIARHGPVLATYSLNQFQMPNEVTLTVHCEKGSVRLEGHESRWRWITEPNGPWHDQPWPAMDRDTLFNNQAHAFLDALEGKRPVLCTLEEGLQTLKVNLAALASSDGQTIPLPVR